MKQMIEGMIQEEIDEHLEEDDSTVKMVGDQY